MPLRVRSLPRRNQPPPSLTPILAPPASVIADRAKVDDARIPRHPAPQPCGSPPPGAPHSETCPVMQRGSVFNIQRYSVHDGPGIRTTVFLKGCPLQCAWCHNPESQSHRPEVIVLESRCLACGECREACAFAQAVPGFPPASGPLPRAVVGCTLCGACVEACPTAARRIIGREMTIEEILREVLQDRVFYETSAGGVTFSGGEPLSQPGFLAELLRACRHHGVHTAIDTCGFACTRTLLDLAPWTDLFLYDLKLMDDARHRAQTGVSNQPILENLVALDRIHPQLWIRIPLIPGINDDAPNLDATARFLATLRHVRRVSLLPFHRTATPKTLRLGRDPGLADLEPPSPEQIASAIHRFRGLGIDVTVGA